MSRMPSNPDRIYTKPSNNIYTVLAVAGVVAAALAIAVVWFGAARILGESTSLFK